MTGRRPDIEPMDPTLQLWLDEDGFVASMGCEGALDMRTRRAFLAAASTALARHPSTLRVDATCLCVKDVDGANALTCLERMAREAKADLAWTGLDHHHVVRCPSKPSVTEAQPVSAMRTVAS